MHHNKLDPNSPTIRLNMTLPAALRDRFRAAIGDQTVSEAVRDFMERKIKAHEREAGK
jgi:hypothetical protein